LYVTKDLWGARFAFVGVVLVGADIGMTHMKAAVSILHSRGTCLHPLIAGDVTQIIYAYVAPVVGNNLVVILISSVLLLFYAFSYCPIDICYFMSLICYFTSLRYHNTYTPLRRLISLFS